MRERERGGEEGGGGGRGGRAMRRDLRELRTSDSIAHIRTWVWGVDSRCRNGDSCSLSATTQGLSRILERLVCQAGIRKWVTGWGIVQQDDCELVTEFGTWPCEAKVCFHSDVDFGLTRALILG